MRLRSRAAAAPVVTAALAAALTAAVATGCGGGGDAAETTTPASAPAPAPAPGPLPDGPPVEVRVIDGDTEAAVPGAAVEAIRGGVVVSRAETDAEGRAEVPLGTAAVTAAAAPFAPARERVREGAAEVELYDPRLQSPEYGGDSSRERYVAGVRVPPPRGEPAWTFESRTLIEFPPAVRDGLVVFGTNSGRVYALHADDGELAWARRQKGEIASTPAIDGARCTSPRWTAPSPPTAPGPGCRSGASRRTAAPSRARPWSFDGLVYVGTWAGASTRSTRRPASSAGATRRRTTSRAARRWRTA